jgi:O-antigen/teichoic acid export membrane protein
VARNAVAPMAARVVDMAFALVYLRILGPANTGAYQFLVVFTTYPLDTLVDFGLNTIVARDVRRSGAPPPAVFRAVAVLRLGLWLLGLPIVLLVYGPGLEPAGLPPEARPAGFVYFVALLPAIVAKTASGLLWAIERLELTAAVSVAATLLRVGLGAAVLFAGLGLLGLASTSLVVNVVSATILSLLLVRQAHWRPAEGDPPMSSGVPAGREGLGQAVTRPDGLLRESWPLFVNQLLQGLFFKVDGLLMPGLAGASAAGAYAAAYKVPEGTGVISSNVTLALFPRLAAEAGDARGLGRAYRLTLRSLLQVGVPLAAGGAILAQAIVTIVGGRGYLPDSAIALAILMWFVPFSYANGLTQYVLIALGRQRFLTLAFLVAAVFNVGANLVLIPRFGYVGAAWVTVASEVVLLAPFGWAVTRSVPGVSFVGEARAPVLATLAMAPVVWWLRDAVDPLVALLAGLLVYPAALWAVGGIDAEQVAIARRLLSRQD